MSTKTSTTTSDSNAETTTTKPDYDEIEQEILDELPERFRELSSIRVGNSGTVQMLLIPLHPYVDSEGKNCSHLMMSGEKGTLEEFGFEFSFATRTNKGAGVKFWFEQSDE